MLYPMLSGVDEQRVLKIGGKGAILEEITKRWPQHNVPEFTIHESSPEIALLDSGKYVYRESNELDLFGGCGLSNTYLDVNRSSQVFIPEASELEIAVLKQFAQSVGKEFHPPVVIRQKQGTPDLWAVVMQHPNNPEVYLVNLSSGPSLKSMNADGTPHIFTIHRNTSTVYFRNYESARLNVALAVKNHQKLQSLGIVSEDWVSISEAGVYRDNHVETYQYTPIRRKEDMVQDISESKLVLGSSQEITLPVVKIPHFHTFYGYTMETSNRLKDECPDFESVIGNKAKTMVAFMEIEKVLGACFVAYMRTIEARYPGGYLVVAPLDHEQLFDIPMRNAKGVIIDDGLVEDDPLLALNHNISRLIYKAPVLAIGYYKLKLQTGDNVKFSCNGTGIAIN